MSLASTENSDKGTVVPRSSTRVRFNGSRAKKENGVKILTGEES